MANIEFDSEKVEHYFKGEYSGKDESYINEVFCDNSKEKELRKLLSRQFSELRPEEEADGKNLDHILYKIHYDINTRLSIRKAWSFGTISRWALSIAGAILLPLVVFMGIKNHKEASLKKETWVEIKAPAWTRAQFSLPDGTTGWLNSNSSIKYGGNFSTDRQVSLTGEAFFDVYTDKKKPFIVHTPEINVQVLGTRFNIASYQNEKTVEVVLEEGMLVFNDPQMNQSHTMKPNDLVIYNKTLKDFSTEVVQPQKYISWKDGKLVFRNDPLDVIARRLERWYNIDVELNVSSPEKFRWRATFVDDNLEEVLIMLKRSLHVAYKIENREIKPDETLSKKKVILTLRT
ncbi:MAG: FecR family protein [Porphyromonadaceae bacterium]|nr:MAG: FecR family protein [Porphyromonadaceae bacterium]